MQNKVKFAIEDISRFVNDEDAELAIAHVNLLSTRPNSHKINITEDILRRDAQTILGKFLVAKMNFMGTDAEGHSSEEMIVGYFPKEQNIQFEEKEEYIVASADAVVSKIYATQYYDMMVKKNYKNTSVEMTMDNPVTMPDNSIDIEGFNLTGCTTLGDRVNPACRDANIVLTRFSEDEADKFYHEQVSNESKLQKFAKERRSKMAEEKEKYVSHTVDTSKESVDMGEWDGEQAKRDLVKEKNFETIGKKACLDFKGGDRTQEACSYPVMNLKDGKWVYNAKGIASARGYAAQHDPAIEKKAIALQKKLGLYKDDEKKEEKSRMSEEKFEIEGREAWGDVIKQVQDHEGKGAYVDSVEKDHIIYTKDDVRYRVEADVKVGEDDKTVSADIHWDTVKKDEQQKMSEGKLEPEKKDEFECPEHEDDEHDDHEDFESKCAEMEKSLKEKDNIIMQKDVELEQLRKFKNDVEEQQKMAQVTSVLAKIKETIPTEKYAEIEKSAKECKFSDVSTWENSVYATIGEFALNGHIEKFNHLRMGMPITTPETKKSLWD